MKHESYFQEVVPGETLSVEKGTLLENFRARIEATSTGDTSGVAEGFRLSMDIVYLKRKRILTVPPLEDVELENLDTQVILVNRIAAARAATESAESKALLAELEADRIRRDSERRASIVRRTTRFGQYDERTGWWHPKW